MGQAIPRQHPAVVLRSHFNQLRALLVVALIAVAGLTAAVVILANDSDEVSGTSSAEPIESINYGSGYVNPSTGYPSATIRPDSPGTRYDGGPEEGSADVTPAQPKVTQQQAFPGLAAQASASSATETKDETASAAAIGQANSSSATETKDESASAAAIGQANSSSAAETKDEAASAAAIGQSNSSSATETKDEAASAAAIGQSVTGR
jgi:hypothetical protein